jgi:hypothetical protein
MFRTFRTLAELSWNVLANTRNNVVLRLRRSQNAGLSLVQIWPIFGARIVLQLRADKVIPVDWDLV